MKWLSLATVFAALSGFVVIIVASRSLGVEAYEQFHALWGLFFALAGLLDGLMHETTRGVSAVRSGAHAGTARPWLMAGVVGGVVALLMLVTSPLWIDSLVDQGPTAIGLLVIGLVSYAFQATLSGVLSGLGLWGRYAFMVALDSGVRLVLSVVAWALGWGLIAFCVITVIGAASWLTVLVKAKVQVDSSPRVFTRRVLSAMAASGSSAALITGFPVVLKATFDGTVGSTGVTVGAVMLAVTFTRAPILVPLQRFQSALIVRFVQNRRLSALTMPLTATLGIGLVGAGAAWIIGPWLMTVITDDAAFVAPGFLLAALTFASACTGSLIITGAAALAREKHNLYVLGWALASVVAFALLGMPLPLEAAVPGALILGPLLGGTVHAVALTRR